MRSASVIARVVGLVGVCAVGAPVAIVTASSAADLRAVTTPVESVAPVTARNPGVGAVSGIRSKTIPLSSVPDGTTSPTTTVSVPTVRTPASEGATVRAGGTAAVAATSTAQGFLGIATELSTIPTLSGSAGDLNTPFLHLLRNLSPGAPLLLRLGGNSGDDSWWAIPGMKQQPYLYTLTPRWGANVQALLNALGGKAILGVNLKEGSRIDSRIAGAEVADFNQYVGASRIDAFELGNEPEFYPSSVVKRRVRGHYTIADYGRKFSNVASALGGAPLAGPGSGSPRWLPTLAAHAGHDAERHALASEAGDGACLSDEELLAHHASVGVGFLRPRVHPGPGRFDPRDGQGGHRPRQAAARGRDQRRLLRG
jgi:hypothetical protein